MRPTLISLCYDVIDTRCPTPLEQLVAAEQRERLSEHLRQLDSRDYEALLVRARLHPRHRTLLSLASQWHCAPRTVMRHADRAVRQLRRRLGQQAEGGP